MSRYCTALACLNNVDNSGILALSVDEFNYLTGDRLWLNTERAMARKCVEAVVYGALDYLGLPRFSPPVEFVAAAIAYYVHPVNQQVAAAYMEGCSSIENLINGVEEPLKAAQIFAHVIKCSTGTTFFVQNAERIAERKLAMGQIHVTQEVSPTS